MSFNVARIALEFMIDALFDSNVYECFCSHLKCLETRSVVLCQTIFVIARVILQSIRSIDHIFLFVRDYAEEL